MDFNTCSWKNPSTCQKKHFHHQDRNRAPDFSLSIRHYSVTVSPTPKCNSVFCQDKSQKEVTQKGFDKIKDFSSWNLIIVFSLTYLVAPSYIFFSKFNGKIDVIYLGDFSFSFERIMLHTEILTRKVGIWIFSLKKKHHKATSFVKIAVQKITISK